MYTGDAPAHEIFCKKVFDLITLANFLIVDVFREPCYELIEKVITTALKPARVY
jgi:hypothetical protein